MRLQRRVVRVRVLRGLAPHVARIGVVTNFCEVDALDREGRNLRLGDGAGATGDGRDNQEDADPHTQQRRRDASELGSKEPAAQAQRQRVVSGVDLYTIEVSAVNQPRSRTW